MALTITFYLCAGIIAYDMVREYLDDTLQIVLSFFVVVPVWPIFALTGIAQELIEIFRDES